MPSKCVATDPSHEPEASASHSRAAWTKTLWPGVCRKQRKVPRGRWKDCIYIRYCIGFNVTCVLKWFNVHNIRELWRIYSWNHGEGCLNESKHGIETPCSFLQTPKTIHQATQTFQTFQTSCLSICDSVEMTGSREVRQLWIFTKPLQRTSEER